MKEIIELIKSTPNDMELGKKVRDLYNQTKLVFPEEMEYTDEYYKKQWVDPYHSNRIVQDSIDAQIENPSM